MCVCVRSLWSYVNRLGVAGAACVGAPVTVSHHHQSELVGDVAVPVSAHQTVLF